MHPAGAAKPGKHLLAISGTGPGLCTDVSDSRNVARMTTGHLMLLDGAPVPLDTSDSRTAVPLGPM